eukprot:12891702-Heterocapsa_arctica.AAC.1
MYTKRAMTASDITKQQKLVQGAALQGRMYEPPPAVVPRKSTGTRPLAVLAGAMAANPKAAATLAAPPADPKAKGTRPLVVRAKSAPPPKLKAAPAKASPPTT